MNPAKWSSHSVINYTLYGRAERFGPETDSEEDDQLQKVLRYLKIETTLS